MLGNDPSTALSDVVQHSNGNYYYVDSRYTYDHGYETMVFSCDDKGEVSSWSDHYAETYASIEAMQTRHAEIIANMEKYVAE